MRGEWTTIHSSNQPSNHPIIQTNQPSMPPKPSILVIGSANMDLIMQVDRIPRVGETVTRGVFSRAYGGKGANQAVGAARAGGRVAFVGCVGADDFGKAMRAQLAADGIDVSALFDASETATGTALIMVDRQGHNLISVAPGANYQLLPQHIDQVTDAMKAAAMIVLQCEIHPDTLDYTLERAATLQRPVLLNLAPARPLSDAQLAGLEWLVVNETEAAFLSGIEVTDTASAETAGRRLKERMPGGVIVTLGAQGSLVFREDTFFHVPAFAVEAVDTTAAGDVYCGALSVALVEGRPVEAAVRFAGAAAALAVMQLGAQPSAPPRPAILEMMER